MSDLEKACDLLRTQGYTCVLCKNGVFYTTSQRGVAPLLTWLESGIDLTGASAADKVVGKGAAFLYCLLGVKTVYSHVMSVAARDTLTEWGIESSYETLTDAIINRKGTDVCPIEKAVFDISEPREALLTIKNTLMQLL